MAEELKVSGKMLEQLGALTEPITHDLLMEVRAQFGDDRAPTLFVLALGIMLGSALKVTAHPDRASDGLTQLWVAMSVPFSVEVRRVQ